MRKLISAGVLLALAAPTGAFADAASDVQALRREFDQVRADYEARLRALEQRVKAAEAAAAAAPAGAPAAPPVAAASPPPSAAAALASGRGNSFNPAMSLILSGVYGRTSRDPADYRLHGFQLPPDAEIGPGTRGFSLAESELGFSASIDPYWRGAANIAVAPDNSVSVEEAFVQTTSLGHGLSLKAGRFFSGIGYLNAQHAHAWDFVDAPLAYQAMLGTQFNDDGLQLTWLAPTERFIELGVEVGRGRSFPGGDAGRNGAGMRAIRPGRASTRCGSCRALVALETLTLSPPSSWVSAAHSGSQASTFSAACAGRAASASSGAASRDQKLFRRIMMDSLRSCVRHARPGSSGIG